MNRGRAFPLLLLGVILLLAALSLVACAPSPTTPTSTPTPTPTPPVVEPEPTPTPTATLTYSKFGFSFEYPEAFLVTESGFMENNANENSGMVTVGVENNELHLFQVAWLNMIPFAFEASGGLEESLEGGFEAFERGSGLQVDRGELVETTKAGHQMLYQYYSVDIWPRKAYGIQGVFYCDVRQRFFQLMTISTTISTKQDILEHFQDYLDSFVCH